MKFQLHFDKDIYNKQMDLLFELAYKKKIDYYKNAQYLGVILIVIGIAMIYNRPNILGIGYVFVFFGLSNLFPFVYYYFKIKSNFKNMRSVRSEEIEINEELEKFAFEFTNKAFVMSSGEHLISTEWGNFLMYLVKENNLILITKEYQSYILGEIEVGKENFQKIISFVEKKIKIV